MIDFLDQSQNVGKPLLPCSSCSFPVIDAYFFCPNCGKKLKRRPPSTSAVKQISFYLFCVFFPPFGLIPAVRYVIQTDSKSKVVGYIGIGLTLASLTVSIILTVQIFSQIQNTLKMQQDVYKQLGY